MICINKKDEFIEASEHNKKESQYLLRVVYDTEDQNVRKLLEGIFGPDQMLDVKNGKVAKINSTLTPKQRDYFLGMVSEALNKMDEENSIISEENLIDEDNNFNQNNIKKEDTYDINSEEESAKKNSDNTKKIKDAKKVSAEKLIKEFTDFLNNIS